MGEKKIKYPPKDSNEKFSLRYPISIYTVSVCTRELNKYIKI